MFALVVYHLRKSLNCLLNARIPSRHAPASLTHAHPGLAAGSGAVFMADRVVVLSRRPGQVMDVVRSGLARPRVEAQTADPAFVAASEHIWSLIRSQARSALLEGAG